MRPTAKNIRTLAAAALLAAACSKDPSAPGTDADASTDPVDTGTDVAQGTDAGAEPDVGAVPDAAAADADMSAPPGSLTESEPNDGATIDEVNALPVGAELQGVIGPGDSDVFAVPSEPGLLYTVTLASAAGGELVPHLTVLDGGRDGESPGADYVKIVRGQTIQFLAMGEGGHLVVVRDARNVDGGSVGGDGFGYTLRVDAQEPAAQGAVDFGSPLTGTLGAPGDVHLWSFDATEGMEVTFDMNAPTGDGRLYVFSVQSGSWIARQDDRALDDPNPLLAAPLFGAGAMYLVVESITEQGGPIGYTIATASP